MSIRLIIWDFDGVLAQTDDNWAKRNYPLTDGVRDILALPHLKHCIATNGSLSQTLQKVRQCGLTDIFSEQNIFTIDMAGSGKGSPDIFRLALQKMGERPENSVVIDNSYSALKGALKADCLPIAFLSLTRFTNSDWPMRLKNIGVKHIYCQMSDIRQALFHMLTS